MPERLYRIIEISFVPVEGVINFPFMIGTSFTTEISPIAAPLKRRLPCFLMCEDYIRGKGVEADSNSFLKTQLFIFFWMRWVIVLHVILNKLKS